MSDPLQERRVSERRKHAASEVHYQHRETVNLEREGANLEREGSNLSREEENTARETNNTEREDQGSGVSISRLMSGSTERLDALHQIVDRLSVAEQDVPASVGLDVEVAAKIASTVALIDTQTAIVISVDVNGQIIYTNSTLDGPLGYAKEDLVSQPLTMIVPERLRDHHRQEFTKYLETGKRAFHSWHNVPIHALCKDGREISATISFEDITVLDKRTIVGVIRQVNHEAITAPPPPVDEDSLVDLVDHVADKVIEKVADKITKHGST